MKKIIISNLKCIIISLCFSLIFGFLLSKFLFPDFQFAILSSEMSDYISVGNRENVKLEINCDKNDCYVDIPEYYIGKEMKIFYTKEGKNIENLYVNGNIQKTYKIESYANDRYDNITLFNIARVSNSRYFAFFIISFLTLSLMLFIFSNKKVKLHNNIIKVIGKKHILITSIIILLTFIFTCGCDAKVIINAARWFAQGIDIYQFQMNSRNLLGTVYAEFPYNPLSMFLYGGFFKIYGLVFKNFPLISGYPHFQVFSIKIVNLILIQITVLATLSFLYKEKKVDKKKVLLTYYLSIFNPITFYVAFIFVQLDLFSLCLLTIGFLLLPKIREKNYLGVMLVSLGLNIKTQLLVILPIFLLSLFIYSFSKNNIKNGLKKFLCSCYVIIVIFTIFMVTNIILKTPYYLVTSNLQQAERLYYTIVNYMGSTSIYVSILFIGMAIYYYVFNIRIDIKFSNLVKINLLYMMILIFLLSSSIVPTPSIYVLSLPAFILILYEEDDWLKIIIIYLCSIGIIVLPMLSDYGDITILLSGFNKKSLLSIFLDNCDSDQYVKFNNIIFTISVASMLSYSLYAIKKSKRYLEVTDNEV